MSLSKVFRSWKIWFLIIVFLLAIVAIRPNPWAEGAAIRSIVKDSSATDAGISSPKADSTPMSREVVKTINNIPIKNAADYDKATQNLKANTTVIIKTDKDIYRLNVKAKTEVQILPELETVEVIEKVFNSTTNSTQNISVNKTQNKTISKVIGVQDLGLRVYDAPTNNIRKGLDLQGGSRVILKPETQLSLEDLDSLVESMKQRLNVYGLSDISVRSTSDLEGKQFIIVEIAGATDEEVKDLLAKQGKFEGKIGNETIFKGGADIDRKSTRLNSSH